MDRHGQVLVSLKKPQIPDLHLPTTHRAWCCPHTQCPSPRPSRRVRAGELEGKGELSSGARLRRAPPETSAVAPPA